MVMKCALKETDTVLMTQATFLNIQRVWGTGMSACGAKGGMIVGESTAEMRLCTGKSMVRCLSASSLPRW